MGGVPEQATPQWLAYARLSGDEAAWDNVLRAAAGTFEQDMLVEALQHKMQVEPGNAQWVNLLVAQYENIGQPERAAALLEERLRGKPARTPDAATERNGTMEALAKLYLRMGRDDAALATLRRQREEFGPSATNALMTANPLYLRGRLDDALEVLRAAAKVAPDGNADFWRTYAEVSRYMGLNEEARIGYDRLLAADQAAEGDMSNMMVVIQDREPRAAAELAEFGSTAPAYPISRCRR
jgi:tetratricopeptide (TPR) repeat protein